MPYVASSAAASASGSVIRAPPGWVRAATAARVPSAASTSARAAPSSTRSSSGTRAVSSASAVRRRQSAYRTACASACTARSGVG